ncbi:MAG: hypothetical protein ACT4OO_07105 [Nitrospiraceae bacterium]
MVHTPYQISLLLFFNFFLSALAVDVAHSPAQNNEAAVTDQLFVKIVDQGFVISLPNLDSIKAKAELQELGQYVIKIPVTLKASPTIQETLEATTRQLGGLSTDAILEIDYGMISWKTRAVRISNNPKTLEQFQRRVSSLVFKLTLLLENGQTYECSTSDVWRFPITAVRELFSYSGKSTIQGLGSSPAFDTKEYGFIIVRNQPISFTYQAIIPEEDFKRLKKVEGKVTERKGNETEGVCMKAQKTVLKDPA